MIVKSWLLLLNAALTFAQGQIPIGGNLVCLAGDDPNTCCTGGETTGQVTLNDRKFQFTCSSQLQVYKSGTTEDDAYECALKCANDPSCKASTFNAQADISDENCFFGMGTNVRQTANKPWITFSEIPPTCLELDDPNKCCTGGEKTGRIVLNNRKFQFTCSSKLQVYKTETTVKSAHECALKCANDPSCKASTFGPQEDIGDGNCLFGMGTNVRQTADKEWITFAELPTPCLESDDPNKCCSNPATQTGEISIDGELWKWTCNSKLADLYTVSKDSQLKEKTVHACASLCAAEAAAAASGQPKCSGISFLKADTTKGKCYFVNDADEGQIPSLKFITVTKVANDDNTVDPPNPGPDPDCDGKLKETEQKLDDCLKHKVDAAELTRCETDKTALVTAEKNCRDDKEDLEKKKEKWRQAHQTCEKEKGDLGDEKQTCEKEKTALSSELIHKNDEIDDLKRKLKALQRAYDTLNIQCNGEGPDGKCRTNIFDAEPRDDLCIIDAGSEQFKIYYGKFDQKPSSFLNTRSANSFKACAERCATFVGVGKNAGKKCVRFSWDKKGDDRACYLIGEGKGLVPTTPSDFSSGILL